MKRLSISIIFLITGNIQAGLQPGEVVRPAGYKNFQCKLSKNTSDPKDMFIYTKEGARGVTIAGMQYDFLCNSKNAICRSTDGTIICLDDNQPITYNLTDRHGTTSTYRVIDDKMFGDSYHCFIFDHNLPKLEDLPDNFPSDPLSKRREGFDGFLCTGGVFNIGEFGGYDLCLKPEAPYHCCHKSRCPISH